MSLKAGENIIKEETLVLTDSEEQELSNGKGDEENE